MKKPLAHTCVKYEMTGQPHPRVGKEPFLAQVANVDKASQVVERNPSAECRLQLTIVEERGDALHDQRRHARAAGDVV